MSGGGNTKGVFNPINLSLFTYTYNNPVNVTDPNGEEGDVAAVWTAALIEPTPVGEALAVAYTVGKYAAVFTAAYAAVEVTENITKGGMIGGGFQVHDSYGMDQSTTIPSYNGDLGSYSAFPSVKNEISVGGFEGELQIGDIAVFPALDDDGVKVYNANPKRVTDKQLEGFFGDKNWHKTSAKRDYLQGFKKELKGSTNADFYVDKKSKEVFIQGNKSKELIPTGDKIE